MIHACHLSEHSIGQGGGPFGAVIMKNDIILGEGHNRVAIDNDPTQHAEIVAIRNACKSINHFDLSGSILYTSCEPCPMCLSAIYWSRIDTVYYGNTKEDARDIGFDDAFIYEEFEKDVGDRKIKMIPLNREDAQRAFKMWKDKEDKIEY